MAPTAKEKFVNVLTGAQMAFFDAINSVFNASGANHTIGLVPDPGATPGTSKFLREDATWVNPTAAGSIPNSSLADMAQSTIKGRAVGAGTGSPQDLTATQATAILDNFVADSGSGGTKGLVPAPAAGDGALKKSLAASGAFVGNLVLLESGSNTNQTSLDIVLTSYTAYRGFRIVLNALPLTDDVSLYIRFSNDGGSTYLAANYGYSLLVVNDTGTVVGGVVNTSAAQIVACTLTAGFQIGNAATEGWKGHFDIFDNFSTAFWARITMQGAFVSGAATPLTNSVNGSGSQKTANKADAIRFLMSSGNITYSYALYGYP